MKSNFYFLIKVLTLLNFICILRIRNNLIYTNRAFDYYENNILNIKFSNMKIADYGYIIPSVILMIGIPLLMYVKIS